MWTFSWKKGLNTFHLRTFQSWDWVCHYATNQYFGTSVGWNLQCLKYGANNYAAFNFSLTRIWMTYSYTEHPLKMKLSNWSHSSPKLIQTHWSYLFIPDWARGDNFFYRAQGFPTESPQPVKRNKKRSNNRRWRWYWYLFLKHLISLSQ